MHVDDWYDSAMDGLQAALDALYELDGIAQEPAGPATNYSEICSLAARNLGEVKAGLYRQLDITEPPELRQLTVRVSSPPVLREFAVRDPSPPTRRSSGYPRG